jgi:hypothetical protein
MKDINLVDILEPKQGHLDYVCSAAVVVKHSPLTTRQREIVDYIRSNPNVKFTKVMTLFSLNYYQLSEEIIQVFKRGIIIGEDKGRLELTQENGVYKE